MPRPNIVYITPDQQKASATSVYGNDLFDCPATRRLAGEGLTFRDAHVVSTICTPSRTSVMTGVHPLVHQVHCWQNKAPWNLPQLAELFAAGGYFTAAAGHYEMGRGVGRGWHYQSDLFERGPLHDALTFKYTHGREDCGWSSGALACTADEGHSALLADRAIELIGDGCDSGAPFFLHVSFNDPHPPYFVPPPYDSIVDPARVTLPQRGDDEGRPQWQFQALRECNVDAATESDLRKAIAVYYGMIAYVDAQIDRIYEALRRRGVLENTWIILASDHGDFAGEKGLFEKCEVPYKCLLHVPLIIVPPSGESAPRGTVVDGLVQSVDLFATMANMAGLDVPGYTQGKDLMAWVRGGARQPLHDAIFAQIGNYHGHLLGKNSLPSGTFAAGRRKHLVEAVRTLTHSYIRDPEYGDEAYDLQTDPQELKNVLNGGGEAPSWVDDLRRRVDQWGQECANLRERLGVVPGNRGFDTPYRPFRENRSAFI